MPRDLSEDLPSPAPVVDPQQVAKQIAAQYNIPIGQITPNYETIGGSKSDRQQIYSYSYLDPNTKIVKNFDPSGKFLESHHVDTSTSGGVFENLASPVTQAISTVGSAVSSAASNPQTLAAIAIAVAIPGVGAAIGESLMSAGIVTSAEAATAAAVTAGATAAEAAAAGAAATATATTIGTAIASTAAQVAQGVPVDKAITNTLVNVGVSQVSPVVAQEINSVIGHPAVSQQITNAVADAVTSGAAGGIKAAAAGGSSSDVTTSIIASLTGSAATSAYSSAADDYNSTTGKVLGSATAGAVTGGAAGALNNALTTAASSIGTPKPLGDTSTKPVAAAEPPAADTSVAAAPPVDQVAATPSGVPSDVDFAKLIGAAQPPTASLDTGVVSDAGTVPRVDIEGFPYQEGPSTPQNIRNLVPEGYHLATSEEIDKIQKSQGYNFDADGKPIGPIPENLYKATLLPNGEYAYIAPNITPESLAAEILPTETIPATQQVAGTDLTAPEPVTKTPEAAAVGIGGPAPDVAPEVAVTAPSAATESATVIRSDPTTGTALVITDAGNIITTKVGAGTAAGSIVSVPSSKADTGGVPGAGTPGVGTGTGTGTGTGAGAVSAEEGIPRVDVYGFNAPIEPSPVTGIDVIPPSPVKGLDIASEPSKDQPILDLIASDPKTEPVAEEKVIEDEADKKPTANYKPTIITSTYLSPKKKTTSAAAPASALGSALGTTGLTAYRGAGEIEGPGTGKARRKVWNEESLKLKDALGV